MHFGNHLRSTENGTRVAKPLGFQNITCSFWNEGTGLENNLPIIFLEKEKN